MQKTFLRFLIFVTFYYFNVFKKIFYFDVYIYAYTCGEWT